MPSETVRNNVEMANDEGSDPASDIQKENPGAATTADIGGKGQITEKDPPDGQQPASGSVAPRASRLSESDPQKVDKMARTAEPGVDHNIEIPT